MTTVVTSWEVKFNLFPQIAAEMDDKAALVVAKIANDLQAHAQTNSPVRTGTLRNSIRAIRITALHWKVVVGAHYGLYVEWGTRYMRAQPYLQPAVNLVRPVFMAAMRQVVTP